MAINFLVKSFLVRGLRVSTNRLAFDSLVGYYSLTSYRAALPQVAPASHCRESVEL